MNFKIKKCNHYSWPPIIKIHNGSSIKFMFQFHDNCWYKKEDIPDIYDLNKLFGFSLGLHHTNSIRIAWLPKFDSRGFINLYTYIYNDKNRLIPKFITTISTSSFYTMSIKVERKNVIFSINNIVISQEFNPPTCHLGYYCKPYFGGNNTAPNDMNMEIIII